jgi:class 3 adenylate cyclase/tetratricopeptide (TPR) repeat protein
MVAVTTPRLQPYLPRLVHEWARRDADTLVRSIEGSMVFVDVSGFTKMSERLARQGKVGAEEVSDVIDDTFSALLAEAYMAGGGLLKFGGDALLLFFDGDGHALRAAAAAHGMRRELRRVGTFATSAGNVTLRMSVGAHTGLYHFFLVGASHRELIVAGPAATATVTMEGAASAGQILLSPALAAALPAASRGRHLGPGVLLAGTPPPLESVPVQRIASDLDLEPFVPVALRETVLAGDVEPEHRSVTVAFVHYGGFDVLVERDGADAAARRLDTLVRAVQAAVEAHGIAFLATDIAPDGGKIILTAGAPVVTGADEEQMLLAVRDVVAANAGLPLHVGVNRGPVFAGAIGPTYRKTYTVMGDAVNLAARLMAKAETGEVIATAAVLSASRTIFATRELEPFLVKGKKKPITAFAVGDATGSRTTIAEAGLPLLGRDEELATLLRAWEAARAGAGGVIEIAAEPGMGKSRLLDELLARIEDARVIHAECRLYQSATPYFPFRALLRSAFGLDGLGDAEAFAALERLVHERSPSLTPWLALIATPLDLDVAPSPEVKALDERFRRARLEEVVAALVAEVAEEPAVVVVEDTHWMDEPSRDLLARVTRALRERPWLVVLSRRPGGDGYAAEDGDGLTRIELRPLGPEPVVALIQAATEDAPLRPQQERELAERAAGNPLFLIELLDGLRRGGAVETMPSSVEGLIHARIDVLPTADRRRLRALSVLGNGFRVEHAPATLGVEGAPEVRRALRPLAEFLSVDRTGWVEFRHALIRDAAYEGLPFRRRQELHAQVGDSILRAAGDDPDEQAELLAVHYWHAGRWAEAWRFNRFAGDGARAVYANVEAARFYERAAGAAARLPAVPAWERVAVAGRLAEVQEHAGEFGAALAVLARARRLAASDPIARADLHVRRARVLIRTGELRSAYRETTRGYRLVEELEGHAAASTRARLSGLASNILLFAGRTREALPLARRAVEQAEAADERSELAYALVVLDDTLWRLGRGAEAVFATRAVSIYASIGDLPGVGAAENSIGVRAYAEGRWDDAVGAYRRAADAFARAGNEAQAAGVAGNVGEVLVSQRRFDEAEPLLREAIRVQRAHGMVSLAMFGEIQLGRLHLGRGDFDEAVAMLESVRDEAVNAAIPADSLEATIYLCQAATERGDAEYGLELLESELERAPDVVDYYAAAVAVARAKALYALGRLDAAQETIDASLGTARDNDALYETAELLLLRADVESRQRRNQDEEALREAYGLLQRLGVVTTESASARRPS